MHTPPVTTQPPSLSPAVVTTQPRSSSSVVNVRQSCCQIQTMQHCCERTCQRLAGATLGATLGAAFGACCGATCAAASTPAVLPIAIATGTCAAVGAVTGAACDRPLRHQVCGIALCCADSCCPDSVATVPATTRNNTVVYTVSEDAARIQAENEGGQGRDNHGFVADDEQ